MVQSGLWILGAKAHTLLCNDLEFLRRSANMNYFWLTARGHFEEGEVLQQK